MRERSALNGKPVGEPGQVAAIAGYFDIPVIMLTSDRAACDEMLALQLKAETVAVKHFVGKASTMSLNHGEACARIRQAAAPPLRPFMNSSPWKVEEPVELKFAFKPDEKQPAGRTVVYTGATVLEAYQAWLGKQ